MIKQPIVTTVSSTKDPHYFPHSGTALAVRLLADRVNWLSVVDTLFPWDRARSRIAPSVLLLMLQNILADKRWLEAMGPEDLRALTPLVYTHVNPYGTFRLNMHERLPLEGALA